MERLEAREDRIHAWLTLHNRDEARDRLMRDAPATTDEDAVLDSPAYFWVSDPYWADNRTPDEIMADQSDTNARADDEETGEHG